MVKVHSIVVVLILHAMQFMAEDHPPNILQIFREPLKPGLEAEYKMVEDDTARICVELKCPNPHLALETLTGKREVWWFNEFDSEEHQQKVVKAYAENKELEAALIKNSKLKEPFTEKPIDVTTKYRADLSRNEPWKIAGARFFVVTVTKRNSSIEGSVFEAPDGTLYVIRSFKERDQADREAAKLEDEARVLAVSPYWGLPAKEWIDADPEFWKSNPISNRKSIK